MNLLQKIRRLSFPQATLLAKAWAILWLLKVLVHLLPFHTYHRLVRLLVKYDWATPPNAATAVAHAVKTMSGYVPFEATCLLQAFATRCLLPAQAKATIYIGVQKNEPHLFKAHAWVDYNHQILIGGKAQSSSFVPITSF